MANLTTHLGDYVSSSSTASSSASTSGSQYDVFVNHRGPDVKTTFASHLYRALIRYGFRVFLDREEMKEGDNISSQIEEAIRGASVHIAILSPTYAESSWCLEELVRMKDSGAIIIPVFFKVSPSDVRYADKVNGQYAEGLQLLQQKKTYDSATIGEEKARYSSITIQNWKNALSYVANLSGFEHRDNDDEGELLDKLVQRVLKKVPKEPLYVAKYPTGLDLKLKEFERTVFSQQQETERKEAKVVGIVGVGGAGKTTLAKAFFNLTRSGYNRSSFLFDVRETARKMSLPYLQEKLLRDLKHQDIKIESRDEGVGILKRHLSSSHVLIVIDDVDDMDQLDGLLLPIKKILGPDSLILITSRNRDVLRRSGVLESSIYILRGMNIPHSKELFCCYAFDRPDPLPEFVDLVDHFVTACDGLPLSLKVFGAQVCGQLERLVWEEILENLHKILPTNIHDRLKISFDSLEPNVKETFLDIACFFLGEDRDKAIRIWGNVGVGNLLDRCLLEVDSENKTKMHDHIRDMGRKIAEEGSMPRRLWHTNMIDDLFTQSSPVSVRGIKMVNSFFDFFRENSQISFQRLFHNWDNSFRRNSFYNPQIPPLEMKHLVSNFHFRKLQLLATEEDHLDDMLKAQRPHLIWLRWYRCSHSSLPDWIPMKNLKVLEMEGARLNLLWPDQPQTAPLQLRELHVCAPLSHIPKSIGHLNYLERIVIRTKCEYGTSLLDRLPDEFCNLRSLKYLILEGFSIIVSLPDRFGCLTNLQHITLEGAHSLQMLPNSFGNLTSLKTLNVSNCEKLQSIQGLGQLTKLTGLCVHGCSEILELPGVEHLTSLEFLSLYDCQKLQSIQGLGQLTKLTRLSFEQCSEILELPGVEHLTSLEDLHVSYCQKLQSIPGLGQLTKLTHLAVRGCSEILELPGVEHLTSLETLSVSGCKKLQSIPGLGQLTKLTYLNVNECSEILELPGVEHLTSLEELSVGQCQKLQSIQGLGQLTKLTSLSVEQCSEILELPGVEHLTSLNTLTIGCEKLQSIQGLGQLTKLTVLCVVQCNEILELPGVEHLTKLRVLSVVQCNEILELPGVEHLTSLERLIVIHCQKLQSIPGLGQLTKLTYLSVKGCSEILELPGVEHLTSLEELRIIHCQKLQSIPGLGQLTKLTILYVEGCSEILELPGVEHLTSLEKLRVNHCQKLQSIPGLGQLTKLTHLYVQGCSLELPGVEHLTSLETLNVSMCEKLQSIPGLGQLQHLVELNVSECYQLRELPDVECLMSLKILNACECSKLQWSEGVLEQLRHQLKWFQL